VEGDCCTIDGLKAAIRAVSFCLKLLALRAMHEIASEVFFQLPNVVLISYPWIETVETDVKLSVMGQLEDISLQFLWYAKTIFVPE